MALWTIFVLVLPYRGAFVYLIARGHKMQQRSVTIAAEQESEFGEYAQNVASTSGGAVSELARLAEFRDNGVLCEGEFQQARAMALAS